MKRPTNLIIVMLLFLISAFSCTSKKSANYLPPLEIQVPESLQTNSQAVEFIEQNTALLNRWSVTLEDLVVECTPYVNKNTDELSSLDRLKLGKIMMEFVANMGRYAVNCAEITQNQTMIESELTPEQTLAFTTVWNAFEKRMNEISTKYQDFGKEEL